MKTLLEMLSSRAREKGEETVFTFLPDHQLAELTISYAELDRRARAIGRRLKAQGCEGERVLLLFQCDLNYIESFFGCIYAGAIAVPLYPPHSTKHLPRLQAIVSDCSPKAVLTASALRASIEKMGDRLDLGTQWLGMQWVESDRIESSEADHWSPPSLSEDSIAFLQYTSGSTGDPKGVILTHGNLLANFKMISQAMEMRPGNVIVSWLPMYHDMGLIGAVLHTVFAGIRSVLMTPMTVVRPLRWLQAVSKYRGTHMVAPNFAYDLCVQRITPEQAATLDLSCLRFAFNGAEPIREATLRAFEERFQPQGLRGDVFVSCYGLAEATLIVSGRDTGRPISVRHVDKQALADHDIREAKLPKEGQALVSSGRPCAPQSVSIVHPDSLERLPPDQIGEIWVTGPNVAQGYWNHPELSSAQFRDQGGARYLRTGDLGFRDAQGELYVTGRLKDLIIIRGKNFAPQDLERVAQEAHPALSNRPGAAFPVELDGEERVALVQELKEALTQGERQALVDAIRDAVSREYGILIAEVAFIQPSTIARTSSGKIRRRETKQQFLAGRLRLTPLAAPAEAAAEASVAEPAVDSSSSSSSVAS